MPQLLQPEAEWLGKIMISLCRSQWCILLIYLQKISPLQPSHWTKMVLIPIPKMVLNIYVRNTTPKPWSLSSVFTERVFKNWRMLFKGVSLFLFLVFWVLSIGPASGGLMNSEPHMCGGNGGWVVCVHEENGIDNDTTEPGRRGVGWRWLIMVSVSPWVLSLCEQLGHSW